MSCPQAYIHAITKLSSPLQRTLSISPEINFRAVDGYERNAIPTLAHALQQLKGVEFVNAIFSSATTAFGQY